MKLLLVLMLLVGGCCTFCKKDPVLPAKILTIYRTCLDNPLLEKAPLLHESVSELKEGCPNEMVCFSRNSVVHMTDYFEQEAFYHRQLESLCKGDIWPQEK